MAAKAAAPWRRWSHAECAVAGDVRSAENQVGKALHQSETGAVVSSAAVASGRDIVALLGVILWMWQGAAWKVTAREGRTACRRWWSTCYLFRAPWAPVTPRKGALRGRAPGPARLTHV